MGQPTDWEALMEETRAKATAAARHSERIVGGVAQLLSAQPALSRSLAEMITRLDEIGHRLGSLEASQSRLSRPSGESRPSTSPTPWARFQPALAGLIAGVALSVVCSWSW